MASKNGKEGYYDVKSPSTSYPRPLSQQAADIAEKSNLYDKDTNVIVDLSKVSPADRAAFESDLIQNGADMSKIQIVGK